MAYILVQHLDPTHESMMVELLASHTAMPVKQATEGMPVEPDHLYTIPPASYLAVRDGALRLSPPGPRHGARLPFDFLLHALAEAVGPRSICVVLSGAGSDGSLGLQSVKAKNGLVIAQDPNEAAYDGMPRSAIMTGSVDHVLPVAGIPEAIGNFGRQLIRSPEGVFKRDAEAPLLSEIIELLHKTTKHDFRLYKHGTLQRRIERRMTLSSIGVEDMASYLALLRKDAAERDLLAKDLLINVTSFFRDPKIFETLVETVIPELIRSHVPDQPLRIWTAGCSTGEETYSLAILFREAIAAINSSIQLQVFASDVDADAVAFAREGLYPEGVEKHVSRARLSRWFTKEDNGYRVLPELRAAIVFTVQDLLADPPFSRIDFVSCRNLLIYLGPEAQKRVVALFHFALREGGLLLLGNSETIGSDDAYFTVISKSERLYRHIGRPRPGELSFLMNSNDGGRAPARTGQGQSVSRQAGLADLCRRLMLESYIPAAVLVNRKHECLYSLGPTDRYLHVAPGAPTHDLLALARQGIRTKLRAALQLAIQNNTRSVVTGGQVDRSDDANAFRIVVQPVVNEGENLLLVCFIDEPAMRRAGPGLTSPADKARVSELENELEATRVELQGAIRGLEISTEEQKAINEETLSANEEYQSTNEELVTSKEELQSLNEELTALNGQLQETLERQRTTSSDLQNILYSTDIATLFLDPQLHIRFFTPATKSFFNVIASDIGRPLADLHSLMMDGTLMSDAKSVLQTEAFIEREVEGQAGTWFLRRILPYRAHDNRIEGVVLTFVDITERKGAATALELAKHEAEQANVAKSRFLAAASHDLRQPLQTLALLQGLLMKVVEGPRAERLVARLDETLGAMSGMLNTLLDINQIEAGVIRPERVDFVVGDLLDRMRDEFAYQAQAQKLAFHVVTCGSSIHSDPRLVEQMVRNLVSNALKYTKTGKVLLGCRRSGGTLRIEIWDTGIGIPDTEVVAIFNEYHQLDNTARETGRGLGLGLSIVKRLGNLLGHRVTVRSEKGKGSVFAIEIDAPPGEEKPQLSRSRSVMSPQADAVRQVGTILVVEDDPELSDLLAQALQAEGHAVAKARDGASALQRIAGEMTQPDLILADFNLPGGMNGLQATHLLRARLHREIPVTILTGDISTATLRDIAGENCLQLNKPVKMKELTQAIQRLLTRPSLDKTKDREYEPKAEVDANASIIFVVDDDSNIRAGIRAILEDEGRIVEDYESCEAFLDAYRPGRAACLLVDSYLPGMKGLELLRRLGEIGNPPTSIMITGNSDVPMAVQAMKAGASDFIEKPIHREELLASVAKALEHARDANKLSDWREDAANRLKTLTPRQRQIMVLVLAGHPSKNIAADLGVSQRTVENHRAAIMKRTGSTSLPALARLALAASQGSG
jgi:two-component system CheB/CheR fusion protein